MSSGTYVYMFTYVMSFNYMWLVNKDIIQLPDYKLKKLYPCIVPLPPGKIKTIFWSGKETPLFMYMYHARSPALNVPIYN